MRTHLISQLLFTLQKINNVSDWCIHFLKLYFSATKWDRNTICVVFYSLNFLKPVHVQNVHLLPQYTPNNDVEQSDIPSGLLLMEYHWWQVQNSMNTGFLDTNFTRLLWGSCRNLQDCFGTLVITGTSLSSAPTFQHILYRSIDFKLVSDFYCYPCFCGLTNSTLQRRWTSTTFSTFH